MKILLSLAAAALTLSAALPAHADLRSRCVANMENGVGMRHRDAKKICKCMIRVVGNGYSTDDAAESCYALLLSDRL